MLSAIIPPNTAEIPTITSITYWRHCLVTGRNRPDGSKIEATHTICFKDSTREQCRSNSHRLFMCHWLKEQKGITMKEWGEGRGIKRKIWFGELKAITHAHLPDAAAVFCRAGWQDDRTGHQYFQQNHQDEVKVDLKTPRRWDQTENSEQLINCLYSEE